MKGFLALLLLTLSGCSGGTPAAPSSPAPEVATPSGLRYTDLVRGIGPEAQPGLAVEVRYVLKRPDGTVLEALEDPWIFRLGQGLAVPGFEEGLMGMRAGGRRRLTVPPDLAYGTEGVPGILGPGETLVFEVELLDAGGNL